MQDMCLLESQDICLAETQENVILAPREYPKTALNQPKGVLWLLFGLCVSEARFLDDV